MKIILPEKTTRIIPGDSIAISRILSDLGIAPSGVIIVKNDRVVPDDVFAAGDDVIRIIRIAHGG